MIQLFSNYIEDDICIVGLLMDLLEMIKFDCIIPLSAFAKGVAKMGSPLRRILMSSCGGCMEETLLPLTKWHVLSIFA